MVMDFTGAGVAGGDVLAFSNHINGLNINKASGILDHVTYSVGNAYIDLGDTSVVLIGVTSLSVDDIVII